MNAKVVDRPGAACQILEMVGPTRTLSDILHFASLSDIEEFVSGLRRFEAGEMSADEFRTFRLARGAYGQRQPEFSMIRVKIPQGILLPAALRRLGDVAERYSRGFGHVTTRQNIQLHMVKLAEAEAVMTALADVGLTTKEACGNTVRNVTACAFAGVCGDELFDTTGYGQAITRYFLRNPFCQALPRKFKIALSGCAHDCTFGAIHDIGLIAQTRSVGAGSEKTVRGFRMKVGGGLSTSPEDAHLLAEFVPVDELLAHCEAVVRVFNEQGNRQNRQRARLKYVIRKKGWSEFQSLFSAALEQIRAEGRLIQPIDDTPLQNALELREPVQRQQPLDKSPAFARFLETNLRKQKSADRVSVIIRLDRGDITAAQLRALADIVEKFGDGTVRATIDQNMVLRDVPRTSVELLYAELLAKGLADGDAARIADVTSCPGTDTCNLAVTGSRELATSLTRKIREVRAAGGAAAAAAEAADSLSIKISGCPNSCGQHHIAGIGFHGTMRRIGSQAVPEYQLHLGGGIDHNGAVFGRHVVKVPARRAADALIALLALYAKQKQPNEPPHLYFRRTDPDVVKQALKGLIDLDEASAAADDFIDLGDTKPFAVAIGAGECAT